MIACLSVSGSYSRMMGKKDKIEEMLKQAKGVIEIYAEGMDRFVL